jgi:hypothetical protein
MGKHLQKRPAQISVKVDAELYKRLAEESRSADRSVAGQLRVILRERLGAKA